MEQNLPMRKRRNETVDFLKFLFALVIVIFHGRKLASSGEFALFQSGYLGVEFFFLVSGFLMMKSVSGIPGTGGGGTAPRPSYFTRLRGCIPLFYSHSPSLWSR